METDGLLRQLTMLLAGPSLNPFQQRLRTLLQSSFTTKFICIMAHPKKSSPMVVKTYGEACRNILRRLKRCTKVQVHITPYEWKSRTFERHSWIDVRKNAS